MRGCPISPRDPEVVGLNDITKVKDNFFEKVNRSGYAKTCLRLTFSKLTWKEDKHKSNKSYCMSDHCGNFALADLLNIPPVHHCHQDCLSVGRAR